MLEAYEAHNGNVRATANELGWNERTVMKWAKRVNPDPLALLKVPVTQGIVDDLVRKVESMPNVKEKNFEALARKLGSKNIVAVLRDPKKFDETTREIARIAFMRVLVEMLDETKLADASLSSLSSVIPVLADAASGKYQFLDMTDTSKINVQELMIKIQMGVKKIQQFNAPYSKELKDELESIVALDPKSAGKVLEAEYKEVKNDNGNPGKDRERTSTVEEHP